MNNRPRQWSWDMTQDTADLPVRRTRHEPIIDAIIILHKPEATQVTINCTESASTEMHDSGFYADLYNWIRNNEKEAHPSDVAFIRDDIHEDRQSRFMCQFCYEFAIFSRAFTHL
jgi:hypothetical protein